VFLVTFDPTIGAEIRKTRPALIIQNDIGNRYSPVTIVAAISSSDGGKVYPTEVPLDPGDGGVGHHSVVLLNQIRTIDKGRLIRKLGTLNKGAIHRVDAALPISLGVTQ